MRHLAAYDRVPGIQLPVKVLGAAVPPTWTRWGRWTSCSWKHLGDRLDALAPGLTKATSLAPRLRPSVTALAGGTATAQADGQMTVGQVLAACDSGPTPYTSNGRLAAVQLGSPVRPGSATRRSVRKTT
jgi:hypothetical protein